MKKIFVLVAAIGLLTACGSSEPTNVLETRRNGDVCILEFHKNLDGARDMDYAFQIPCDIPDGFTSIPLVPSDECLPGMDNCE